MNQWEQRYQSGETGWDRGGPSPAIDYWLEHEITTPARVLIPGCGRGHEVIALARCGLDVTAVDIAPSATAHLEQQLAASGLTATVILGDLFDFLPDKPFDAVYEQTCLCAIQPDQRAAYEAKLHAWLKPGGKLLALFMQTGDEGGPPFHCDLLAMRRLFAESRWDWPQSEQVEAPLVVPHRNGRFELGYTLIRK